MTLPTLWQLFNLRESPSFQQTLRAGQDRYRISLFVGRECDAERYLRAVAGSPASTRHTVHGPVGVGKTTLVEHLKARPAEARPRSGRSRRRASPSARSRSRPAAGA